MKIIIILSFISILYSSNSFSLLQDDPFCETGDCHVLVSRDTEEMCPDLMPEVGHWFQFENEWETRNPIEMRMGRVRNQGSAGICFAYAAADLISYEVGTKVSGLHVFKNFLENSFYYNYFQEKLNIKSPGGEIITAVKASLNKALCSNADLPDIYPHSDEEISQLAKSITCQNPSINFSNYKLIDHYEGKYIHLLDVIDENLAQNHIVGIGYNVDLLRHDFRYIGKDIYSGHVNTVIGRYFDHENQKCRYILRNTWGIFAGIFFDDPTRDNVKFRDGYMSITEKALHSVILNVTTIKKEN